MDQYSAAWSHYIATAFCERSQWPAVRRTLFLRTLALAQLSRGSRLSECVNHHNVARAVLGYLPPPRAHCLTVGNDESAEQLAARAAASRAISEAARVDLDATPCKLFNDKRLSMVLDALRPHALYSLRLGYSRTRSRGPSKTGRSRSKRSRTKLADAGLATLATRCRHLRCLALPGCHWLSDGALAEALPACHELVALDLRETLVSDATVEKIAKGCRGLVRLDLLSTDISDGALRHLAMRSCFLEHLDVSDCGEISDVGVVAIAGGCPLLTQLSLRDCHFVGNRAAVALASGCPALKTIDFSGCDELCDGALIALAQGCPALVSVRVNDCRRLSDASIRVLCEATAEMLLELGISGLRKVTSVAIEALRDHCPNLAVLEIEIGVALMHSGLVGGVHRSVVELMHSRGDTLTVIDSDRH